MSPADTNLRDKGAAEDEREPRDSDRPAETSPLQAWLVTNGFAAAQLEKEIRMTRQSLQQIREGRDCRLSTARRILGGCRRLARRNVRMDEIFNLEPDETVSMHRSSV